MLSESALLVFNKKRSIIFYLSLILILLFFISTLIIILITQRFNFYTFFFRNIKDNLFRMIASAFYVGLLGFGILFLIISLFNEQKQIYCYQDRFEVTQVMQKKIIINYQEISTVNIRIFYLNQNGKNFNQYKQKECRVYFNNNSCTFYLAYPTSGYFDDLEPVKNHSFFLLNRNKLVSKNEIEQVIRLVQQKKQLKIPFFPEESPLYA